MRLIFASAEDLSARALADRWGSDALLLTVDDLRRAPWCLELDATGQVRAELADTTGKPVRIAGVVNRIGVITPADLPEVRREDRRYAAAEFTAFLTAWLDACPAPVLNRPTAGSLNGPAWHPAQWQAAARSVGLRVAGGRQRIALTGNESAEPPWWAGAIHARVVGESCFGAVHPEVGERLRALARLAGTALFAATVAGPEPDAPVGDLSAWPDLTDPEVADAVGRLLPARSADVVTQRPGSTAAAAEMLRPGGPAWQELVGVSVWRSCCGG